MGFRPFVFKLASHFDIAGDVTNTSNGVVIRAVGKNLHKFTEALSAEAPPLARIDSLEHRLLDAPIEADGFRIIASQSGETTSANIPPDISLCADCLEELNDPDDRRYRYPFTNCTNCGPRFSIIETIPYDRPKTSMKHFPMCEACNEEYGDPLNRRFHAQPNACPDCGPAISWHDSRGRPIDDGDAILNAVCAISADQVVALRGLGGFHLCVNGCSEIAVATLRRRKNRPDKPLAMRAAGPTRR